MLRWSATRVTYTSWPKLGSLGSPISRFACLVKLQKARSSTGVLAAEVTFMTKLVEECNYALVLKQVGLWCCKNWSKYMVESIADGLVQSAKF